MTASSKVRLALWALFGLFLIILFSKIASSLNSLNQPYWPDVKTSANRSYTWEGQSNLNLIFKSETIEILSADPISNQLTLIKLPQDTYMNLAFGFGSWPIRSVYSLGQSEASPIGILLLQRSIEKTFAIPVDGYIITTSKSSSSASSFVSNIHQNPLSSLAYLGQIKSDLTLSEILKLFWLIKNIRPDKVYTVDLGQSQITSSILLPDGSRALGIDQPKLDQYVRNQFQDLKIRDEAVTIGVFNSTSHSGLAEMASRLITNLGGRVIFTANSTHHLDKTVILGSSSYTRLRLKQIFVPQEATQPSNLDPSRADLTIFLGEDYYSYFNRGS